MNTQELQKLPLKKIAVSDAATLAYVERGTGEPVVFIHGALGDYRTWRDQFDALADDFRVLAYSRRGHYPNARSDAADTRARHAADLIQFLKTLRLEKAHLIGHSDGAGVALLAALEEPHLIGSLILGEPSPFPAVLDDDAEALLAEQRAGFEKARRLAQSGEREAAVREFLHTVIGIDAFGLLPLERRAVILDNAGTLPPMLANYYESPVTKERLKNLKVPVMLVAGEISPLISRVTCKSLDRYLPHSRIAVLKCASHGLQMENPEGFLQLVLDFLAVNKKTAPLDENSLLFSPIFNQKLS